MVFSKLRGDRSALSDLRTSGCMKMLFPRGDGKELTGILLNTAGGVTGGDHLSLHAGAKAGSHLRLSTQASERIYRAQPGEVGQIETDLSAADGARLDWLPQETILFDRAALIRRLTVNLSGNARLLLAEPLIFGRAAMGETVDAAQLTDQIRVIRDGSLIFADTMRLQGDLRAHMARTAIGAGAGAMATVLLATTTDEADSLLPQIRALLPDSAGASVIRPGLLYLRLLSLDGFELRKTLLPVLTCLNGGNLPRTWMI
ncbi:urease accessory protein UreD [Thalassovita sp.]|uniref:urease accessory protein UreD n=1 Tax=Thalassovita sp. TaxID=1979401 RepID=UPI002B275E30|nr:urease accessory protein UreD [Thalassovita sp.]